MSSVATRPQSSIPSCALLFCNQPTFAIPRSMIRRHVFCPEQAAAPFGETSGGHPLKFLANRAPGIADTLLATLFRRRAAVRTDPGVPEMLPLARARRAHERVEAGDVSGKPVLGGTEQ